MNGKRMIGAVFLSTCFAIASVAAVAVDLQELERLILEKTNIERTLHKLPSLALDRQAQESSKGHAMEMAKLEFMGHYSPTSEKRTPAKRNWRAGITATLSGENVLRHSVSGLTAEDLAQNAVEWWMNSPNHRKNILNAEFTHIGIGAELGQFNGRKTVFIGQTFLRRIILDVRLVLERSEETSLNLRISGRTNSNFPLAVFWYENGNLVLVDIAVMNNSFVQTFYIPKGIGDVDVFLGRKIESHNSRSVEVVDCFRIDTNRQTVYPPSY